MTTLRWKRGVFCGPSMVFTNVHNPRALIERKDEYRDTLISGVILGANCSRMRRYSRGILIYWSRGGRQ